MHCLSADHAVPLLANGFAHGFSTRSSSVPRRNRLRGTVVAWRRRRDVDAALTPYVAGVVISESRIRVGLVLGAISVVARVDRAELPARDRPDERRYSVELTAFQHRAYGDCVGALRPRK
jgi:hypothetical protein